FLEARGFEREAIREDSWLWSEGRHGGRLMGRGAVGLRLARLLRRDGHWGEARTVLEECWQTQSYPYPAAIELAKLLEHQARDLNAARRIVSDAQGLLGRAAVPNPQWQTDLDGRLGRLDRRLGLPEGGGLALTA